MGPKDYQWYSMHFPSTGVREKKQHIKAETAKEYAEVMSLDPQAPDFHVDLRYSNQSYTLYFECFNHTHPSSFPKLCTRWEILEGRLVGMN